jgi:hypothetical protein
MTIRSQQIVAMNMGRGTAAIKKKKNQVQIAHGNLRVKAILRKKPQKQLEIF